MLETPLSVGVLVQAHRALVMSDGVAPSIHHVYTVVAWTHTHTHTLLHAKPIDSTVVFVYALLARLVFDADRLPTRVRRETYPLFALSLSGPPSLYHPRVRIRIRTLPVPNGPKPLSPDRRQTLIREATIRRAGDTCVDHSRERCPALPPVASKDGAAGRAGGCFEARLCLPSAFVPSVPPQGRAMRAGEKVERKKNKTRQLAHACVLSPAVVFCP